MRHREILSVRYDQIDFASRRIFIPHAKAGERELTRQTDRWRRLAGLVDKLLLES